MAEVMAALSVREREVLRALLRLGYAKAVAAELGISTRTVENHLASARAKLGVDSTLQAASLLREFELQDRVLPEPRPEVAVRTRRFHPWGVAVVALVAVALVASSLLFARSIFGPPDKMPNLIGKPWGAYRPLLASLAGRVTLISVGPPGMDPSEGKVTRILDQYPQPGERITPRTPIALWTGLRLPTPDESFSGGEIGRDWTLKQNIGTVTVAGTTGKLRYTLDGNTSPTGDANATHVSRVLIGRRWSLETKVRYHLPPGNGRQLCLRIIFGAPEWLDGCKIEWVRTTDGAAHVSNLERVDVGDPSVHMVGLDIRPATSDTVVLRIARLDQDVTVRVVPDGGVPAERTYRFRTPLPSIQHLVLTGASFENSGGWAEYEYFRLQSLAGAPPSK
jgi:DNA-binding CsgD family transcriptional regulator